jgi:LCP family protein required for cell wall assembly
MIVQNKDSSLGKKKKTPLIVIAVILLVSVILGLVVNSAWDKPLGPSLGDITYADTPSSGSVGSVAEETSIIPMEPIEITTHTLEPESPPLCGDVPVLTILTAGIDFRGDNYLYGLADVIRVTRIDFTKPQVTIFGIDRGLWVEIPGISEHYGLTHGMLNQAYFFGVPAMGYYDGPAGGAGLLAQTLDYNFGLEVDNYLVVSMAAFVLGIDAIGGIDVYLEKPVYSDEDLGSFFAGWHHLDGEHALHLARIRTGYNSLIRFTNQDAILQGIFAKLKSPEIIVKIPELIQVMQKTVLTDLSPQQINSLYCIALKIGSDDLAFAEIPEEYYISSWLYDEYMHQDINYFDIDFDVVRAYIDVFQNGTWP